MCQSNLLCNITCGPERHGAEALRCGTQVKAGLAEAQQQLQAARAKKRAAPLVCRLLRGALTVVATLALQRLHQVTLWTSPCMQYEGTSPGMLALRRMGRMHACSRRRRRAARRAGACACCPGACTSARHDGQLCRDRSGTEAAHSKGHAAKCCRAACAANAQLCSIILWSGFTCVAVYGKRVCRAERSWMGLPRRGKPWGRCKPL